MTEELELVRGSGNVFRDFGYVDAEALQLKARLASRIIGILDDDNLSAKAAAEKTGMPAVDFSRIRGARLDKLSIERLLMLLAMLGQDVDVNLTFTQRSGNRAASA